MVLAPACLGDFDLKREKVQLLKAWSIICWALLVMLVFLLRMERPAQGFSTSMSVFLLFVAWTVMIDYGIEKPGIAEGRLHRKLCVISCVSSEWGRNKERFWTWKIFEEQSFGTFECSCNTRGDTWEHFSLIAGTWVTVKQSKWLVLKAVLRTLDFCN